MSPFLRTFLAVTAVVGCVGFPVIVYLVGFYCGANWAKKHIERKAGVRIESDLRIVPDAPPEARE